MTYYVGPPKNGQNPEFKTLQAARKYLLAHPEFDVIGRWKETVRVSPLGVRIRSRSGELVERR